MLLDHGISTEHTQQQITKVNGPNNLRMAKNGFDYQQQIRKNAFVIQQGQILRQKFIAIISLQIRRRFGPIWLHWGLGLHFTYFLFIFLDLAIKPSYFFVEFPDLFIFVNQATLQLLDSLVLLLVDLYVVQFEATTHFTVFIDSLLVFLIAILSELQPFYFFMEIFVFSDKFVNVLKLILHMAFIILNHFGDLFPGVRGHLLSHNICQIILFFSLLFSLILYFCQTVSIVCIFNGRCYGLRNDFEGFNCNIFSDFRVIIGFGHIDRLFVD